MEGKWVGESGRLEPRSAHPALHPGLPPPRSPSATRQHSQWFPAESWGLALTWGGGGWGVEGREWKPTCRGKPRRAHRVCWAVGGCPVRARPQHRLRGDGNGLSGGRGQARGGPRSQVIKVFGLHSKDGMASKEALMLAEAWSDEGFGELGRGEGRRVRVGEPVWGKGGGQMSNQRSWVGRGGAP